MQTARSFAAALILLLAACAQTGAPAALNLEDAERFAALFAADDLSAEALQRGYLDPGTEGIEIFTPHRIKSAENLAAKVAANREGYRRALDLCLPAARDFAREAGPLMQRVADLLNQPETAPAYVLFGGDNSGGTADARGLVLGLEVLCRFADDEADARVILEDFVVHEITHVYQHRAQEFPDAPSLLQAALVEGFADFVMEMAMGRPSVEGAERARFGEANEVALWRAFKLDVAAGSGYGTWLYGGPADDRPGDLGYWIGKRICEAYYARAEDKEKALQELLVAEDPPAILAASGYGEEWE